MGLSISVGLLADLLIHDEEGAGWHRDALEAANAVLVEQGYPTHTEPETLPELDDRANIHGFPYSFLHYLRRAYARWHCEPDVPIPPCTEGEDPSEDDAVEFESDMLESHLLCHSDCEGFYFPIPLDDIIIDEKNEDRIRGGLLGSSYNLIEELIEVAPGLDIELKTGKIDQEQIDRIEADYNSTTGLWIERVVWLALFEAARLSIEHKSAICFC